MSPIDRAGTTWATDAAAIAHDLNNLLTLVVGFAQQIEQTADAGGTTEAAARRILGAAERAGWLTDQLGALSRRESGHPTAVDVNAVIADLHELLAHTVGDEVVLVVRHIDGLPRIMADRGHVDRVLLNLVINAREAMPHGGIVTIQTDTVQVQDDGPTAHQGLVPGPHVRVAVTDSGAGMAADVAGRALDSYFTTKIAGASTGLGLSSVRALVESAGGAVELHTEPDLGTTVTLLLPAVASAVSVR